MEQKTGIFLAPVIQMLINKTWFQGKKDDGVVHPEFFEDEMLSLSTIALVLMIVSPYIYFPHSWLMYSESRLKITSMNGSPVGITTGNPGVFPGNLYPYPSKPTPMTTGVGFHGSG